VLQIITVYWHKNTCIKKSVNSWSSQFALVLFISSVLGHCRFGDRRDILPVKLCSTCSLYFQRFWSEGMEMVQVTPLRRAVASSPLLECNCNFTVRMLYRSICWLLYILDLRFVLFMCTIMRFDNCNKRICHVMLCSGCRQRRHSLYLSADSVRENVCNTQKKTLKVTLLDCKNVKKTC